MKQNRSPVGDNGIVALFEERDEDAIRVFTERYGALCRMLAKDITGSEETAEELFDDCCLRLWNTIPPTKPLSLKAYACRIIRNLALQTVEKQNAAKRSAVLLELEECISADPDTEPAEPQKEEQEALGRLIDDFLSAQPKIHALIFVRRYFYSDSVTHIAALTGYDENKVSRILSKMRKKLKAYLEKGGITV